MVANHRIVFYISTVRFATFERQANGRPDRLSWAHLVRSLEATIFDEMSGIHEPSNWRVFCNLPVKRENCARLMREDYARRTTSARYRIGGAALVRKAIMSACAMSLLHWRR